MYLLIDGNLLINYFGKNFILFYRKYKNLLKNKLLFFFHKNFLKVFSKLIPLKQLLTFSFHDIPRRGKKAP